jgi:hypothetical protein
MFEIPTLSPSGVPLFETFITYNVPTLAPTFLFNVPPIALGRYRVMRFEYQGRDNAGNMASKTDNIYVYRNSVLQAFTGFIGVDQVFTVFFGGVTFTLNPDPQDPFSIRAEVISLIDPYDYIQTTITGFETAIPIIP